MGFVYDKCYLNSNDLGVIFPPEFGLSGICIFECIDFRGPRDFINRRGLLIQGGDYIYIYIYMYNPHLGSISAPPPYLLFSSKRPFSLFIYYQTDKKYTKFWPRLYQSDGRYQLFILGVFLWVILGIIHFLSKRDPPKVISCTYIVLIKRNTF